MRATAAIIWMLAAMGGCSESFYVKQYPEFYTPQIKSVAVMPFINESLRARAGDVFASHLAAGLDDNGTYLAAGPYELRRMLGDKELDGLVRQDANASIDALRNLGKFEAMICGTVLAYGASGERRLVADYPSSYSFRWGGPVYYYEYSEHAEVIVEASLIRLSDGNVLASTTRPIGATVSISGYPYSPDVVVHEAMSQVVDKLVEKFAVVTVKLTVDPSKALRTSDGPMGEGWAVSDFFRTTDEKMFVLLSLPPQGDRNTFRIAISRAGDKDKVLAEQQVTWSRKDSVRAIEFSPREFCGGVGGDFRVTFYSGDKRVMSHKFKME